MRKLRLLKQKPYCCVPVCLAMILDRRIIRHDSQEKIGNDLGLIVPPESAKYFKKVRTGRRPAAGFGTQIQKKEFSINHFFIKYKISLREKYYLPKSIGDALAFMSSNLKSGGDIIMCFNHKTVYGKGDWGARGRCPKSKTWKSYSLRPSTWHQTFQDSQAFHSYAFAR